METKEIVYLMDASAFIHRAFYAIKNLTTRLGEPTGAVYGFTASLLKLIRDKNPQLLAVVFDSRSPTRRHLMYPQYKANRPPMDPSLAAQQTPIREIVKALGLHSLQQQGYEADDIIAAMCRQATEQGHNVVIVSGDKDFYQLLSPTVSMYDPDPKKSSAMTQEDFKARFNLEPGSFLEMQALMGDKSDNIPGVPQIGEKKARDLIETFGTIDQLYQNLDKISSASTRERLKEYEDSARLSRKLAELGVGLEPPTPTSTLTLAPPDAQSLTSIFASLEFYKLLNDFKKSQLGQATLVPDAPAPPTTHYKTQTLLPPLPKPEAAEIEPTSDSREKADDAGAPQDGAPQDSPHQDGPHRHGAPQDGSAQDKAPEDGASKNVALGDIAPEDTAPPDSVPADDSPADSNGPKKSDATQPLVDSLSYVLVDNPGAWAKLLEAVDKADRIAIDVLTNSRQASQTNIVGLGLAAGPNEAFYIPIAHDVLGANNQKFDEVKKNLGDLLTRKNKAIVGLNAKFGWHILSRYGLTLPAPTDDPMLASYLLNPDGRHDLDALSFQLLQHQPIPLSELVKEPKKKNCSSVQPLKACQYSGEAADLSLRLASVLRQDLEKDPALLVLYDELELPLEELLTRIEETGVLVDSKELMKISEDLDTIMAEKAKAIYTLADKEFNLASPKQLSDVLFMDLGLPSGKKTAKKTGFSTDNEVLTELSPLFPIAKEILTWREVSKLKNTYADKLPLAINPLTGRIHTSYNQASTATGRLSSSEPNLQNIPARSEVGKRIRSAFKAKEGCCLISADYSQIELRVMAHFSGDKTLINAFKNDEDIHSQTACQIFDIPIGQLTAERRREAKTINFGIIYGQRAHGLSKQLGIPQAAAKQFIDNYFRHFPGVKNFIEQTHREVAKTGQVSTWFGRRRYLPAINAGGSAKQEAERMAVNTPIQGTAADIIKIAMLLVDRRLKRERLKSAIIMQVHDELVLEVPLDEKDAVKNLLIQEMADAGQNPPLSGGKPLTVPLKVDVAEGECWDHA